MSKAIPKECMASKRSHRDVQRNRLRAWYRWRRGASCNDSAACEGIHLEDNRRPRSNLRFGDMGYVRVCAGSFVAGTKQKACLEMAEAELIREITQGRSLN